MQVIIHIAELRTRLEKESTIVFVPTMGNLHEGHLDLVQRAREQGGCVVVSIFVNSLQFGPSEDFDKYPRTLKADCEQLQGLADIVFTPAVNEMYPLPQAVLVEPSALANDLEGAARPGHFCGMATVVLKLLNIVRPHIALFGKKDYQQLHVIRQMVAQLNLAVGIVGCETVRAPDGLALSSRNQYLSAAERTEATFLYRTLCGLQSELLGGLANVAQDPSNFSKDKAAHSKLEQCATEALAARGWQVDYVAVRSQADLAYPSASERNLVILAAARLGQTRLIDNLEVCLKT